MTTLAEFAVSGTKSIYTEDLLIAKFLNDQGLAVMLPWTPERPKTPRTTPAQLKALGLRQVVVIAADNWNAVGFDSGEYRSDIPQLAKAIRGVVDDQRANVDWDDDATDEYIVRHVRNTVALPGEGSVGAMAMEDDGTPLAGNYINVLGASEADLAEALAS